MRNKILWVLVSCVMALSLVLASCGPAAEEKEEAAPPTKPAPTKPAAPKELTVCFGQSSFEMREPLDPYTTTGGSSVVINHYWSSSLIYKDVDGSVIPDLAASWELSPDLLRLDFTLRKGLKFQNGEPFTAEDVEFSVERAEREDLLFVYGPEFKRKIDRVEVVDDYHISFYFTGSYPGFMDRFSEYFVMVPKDYVEKVGDEEFAAHPVGIGPFKVIDWERDYFINFEAVKHHRKTPEFDILHHIHVPEDATRLAMLKTGEADFIATEPTQFDAIRKDPDLRLIWTDYTTGEGFVFLALADPDTPSPFHDIRVREAFSLAINREELCEAVLKGGGEPSGSFLAPYNAGYEYLEPDPYDPEKARELLAEAGYPDGFETVVRACPSTSYFMEPVCGYLNDIGIKTDFRVLETGVIWQKFCGGEYTDGIIRAPCCWWVGRVHPASATQSMTVGTWAPVGRTFPEFHEAFERMESAVGEEAIAEAAKDFNRLLLDSRYRTLLFAGRSAHAVGPRVEYWENSMGQAFPRRLEYLRLKD